MRICQVQRYIPTDDNGVARMEHSGWKETEPISVVPEGENASDDLLGAHAEGTRVACTPGDGSEQAGVARGAASSTSPTEGALSTRLASSTRFVSRVVVFPVLHSAAGRARRDTDTADTESGKHSEAVIRCGDLVVKLDQKRVEIAGRDLDLTRKEYEIIELLASRPGAPITKEMFLNHMYGGMDEPEQKIIDVFVCKARKKIVQASGGRDYIETVRGRGYMLRQPKAMKSAS